MPEPTEGIAIAPAAPASPWRTPVYPRATWEKVPNPELAGYRSSALDSLTSYLKTIPTTGLVVTVHGRVLYSYGDLLEESYLASARKSVLSMLYGNYVTQGRIKLSSTLAELGIDDRPPLTAGEKQATVRDLLMTSSGIYHEASNPGDNLGDAPARGSQKPGAYFLYSNWDFNVLGSIFEKAAQRNIYDAVEVGLALPIGMEDWRRDLQSKSGDTTRSVHLAYHMWFSTRDMARLGYLMLREGKWEDKQVIPAAWVREKHVTTDSVEPDEPALGAGEPPGLRLPLVDPRGTRGKPALRSLQRPRRVRPVCPRRTQARHGHRPQAGTPSRPRNDQRVVAAIHGGGAPGGGGALSQGLYRSELVRVTSHESRVPRLSNGGFVV